MNAYITGNTIRKLREAKKLTQVQLAEKLDVSDKAVSKWETGKGLPDITLLEPLAAALGVSGEHAAHCVLCLPCLWQCDSCRRAGSHQLLRYSAAAAGAGGNERGAYGADRGCGG